MFRTLSLVAAVSLGLAGATSADAKACRDAAGHFAACPKPGAAPAAKGCRDAAGHFAKCGSAKAGPPAAAQSAAPMSRAAPAPSSMATRPTAAAAATGAATARCKDGSLSYSKHRSGTCAGHHGVATWM